MLIGLFGGYGELDDCAEAQSWLFGRASGDARVCVVDTGGGPELTDPDVAFFARFGHVDVVTVGGESSAATARGARLTFMHDGNPAPLTAVLRASALWPVLVANLESGCALGATSGGAMILGDAAPDLRKVPDPAAWEPGLVLLPDLRIGTHWSGEAGHFKQMRAFCDEQTPAERALIAIDERAAAVTDGNAWTAYGTGGVHLRTGGVWADV